MRDLLTLDIAFDSYHLVVPYFIGTLLAIVLLAISVKKVIVGARSAAGGSAGEGWKIRFFDPGFDRTKLFGALGLTVVYVVLLDPLGFLLSSVLFIVAISLVLRPVFTRRALIGVGLSALLTPTLIWLVFGQLFDITLP